MICLTKLFQQKRRRIGYILAFSAPTISKRDSSVVMKDKSKTSIVIGELIKRELKKQGKTSVWLAGELGCHRTNVYKIYDRSTIDSGMLFHISQLLKVDFFKLYSDALKKKL